MGCENEDNRKMHLCQTSYNTICLRMMQLLRFNRILISNKGAMKFKKPITNFLYVYGIQQKLLLPQNFNKIKRFQI